MKYIREHNTSLCITAPVYLFSQCQYLKKTHLQVECVVVIIVYTFLTQI